MASDISNPLKRDSDICDLPLALMW